MNSATENGLKPPESAILCTFWLRC